MGPLNQRIKELEAVERHLRSEVRSLSKQVAANAPSYNLCSLIQRLDADNRALKGENALVLNEKAGEYNKRVAAEKLARELKDTIAALNARCETFKVLADELRDDLNLTLAELASTRGAYDNTSHRLEVYKSEVARLESVIAGRCSPPKPKDLFMAIVELANKCAATMVDWTEPLQLTLPAPAFAALQNELGAGVALSQSLKSVEPHLIRLNLTIPVVIEDSLSNYDYGTFRNPMSPDPMLGFERTNAFAALFSIPVRPSYSSMFSTTDPDVRAKWAQKANWGKD